MIHFLRKRRALVIGPAACLAFGIVVASRLTAQQAQLPIQFDQPRNVPEFQTMLGLGPETIQEGDGEAVRLRKQRFNTVLEELSLRHEEYRRTLDASDPLLAACDRFVMAGRELNGTDWDGRIRFHDHALRYIRELERHFKPFSRLDLDSMADFKQLEFLRLGIELDLEQARTAKTSR